MPRRVLAISGVILLLGGVGLSVFLSWSASRARDLDRALKMYFYAAGPFSCLNPLEEVSIPKRVMSESESQALAVILSNNGALEECEADVNLNAPNFTFSPPESKRTIRIPRGKRTATIAWILNPQKLGTFQVAVEANRQVHTVGIKVTNLFGLSAWQVQLISYIATFLGPMLTATWWYEKWRERKIRKSTEQPKRDDSR